jgi:cbb3-type cytochrome oxidase maturation protein
MHCDWRADAAEAMDSLYLLLPLSVLLVLALIALFAWALHGGQFDDLDREAWRVLEEGEGVATVPPRANPDLKSQDLDVAQVDRVRP